MIIAKFRAIWRIARLSVLGLAVAVAVVVDLAAYPARGGLAVERLHLRLGHRTLLSASAGLRLFASADLCAALLRAVDRISVPGSKLRLPSLHPKARLVGAQRVAVLEGSRVVLSVGMAQA